MEAYPIYYERIVQEVYEAVLRDGDVAVDVGAHTGRHSFPMARCVAPGGQVFAFEPLPVCRETLQAELTGQHPELASVLTVWPQALGERPGESPFVVAEDALPFSGFQEVQYPVSTRLRRIHVAVETIDNLFLPLPALRFLKIDAEGAELAILRGAAATLDRCRPVVAFEFGSSAAAVGQDPLEMAAFWRQHGYRIYNTHGRRLTEADFAEATRRLESWDYVAVPAEDADLEWTVRETLQRPRVNWLAVSAYLRQAGVHAPVGTTLPPLRSFRGPLHGLARGAGRLVLWLARIVTGPQREYNQALLRCLGHLADGLEQAEAERNRRDLRIRELERSVARLREMLAQAGVVVHEEER